MRLQRIGYAVLALSLLPLLTIGCSSAEKANVACGVIVDSTSYYTNYNLNKRLEHDLMASFTTNECSEAILGVVTSAVDSSACSIQFADLRVTQPGGAAQVTQDKAALQKKAIGQARDLLMCGHSSAESSHGSDPIGALRNVATEVKRRHKTGDRDVLIVFSDLVQNSGKILMYGDRNKPKFTTNKGREDLVNHIIRSDTMPNLAGFSVEIHGLGARYSANASIAHDFVLLWTDLLKRSGSPAWKKV